MRICDFTLPEVKYFLAEANFTKDEEELFRYRSKDISLEECAELMNTSTSTVNRLSKRVNTKVKRLDEMCKSGFTRNT